MSPGRFPPGSVRAAVTAFGDAWHAAFIGPHFECPPARDAVVEEDLMTYCTEELANGRRASMDDRAFIGVAYDEVTA